MTEWTGDKGIKDITAASFPPTVSSSPSPVKGRTIQVLVVDDSIVQRKMCRVLLAGKVTIIIVIIIIIVIPFFLFRLLLVYFILFQIILNLIQLT